MNVVWDGYEESPRHCSFQLDFYNLGEVGRLDCPISLGPEVVGTLDFCLALLELGREVERL